MGYLCPVCQEPFADSQQCANHLAVTAILHGENHEEWLAEAVDEWADKSVDATDESVDWESIPRAELAELVAERADETDDHDHPGDHTHPVDNADNHAHTQPTNPLDQPANAPDQPANAPDQPANAPDQPAITESAAAVEGLDADAQAILRQARELTERMHERGPDEGKES